MPHTGPAASHTHIYTYTPEEINVSTIDSTTTNILSQVQRIWNTGQGYEVRTTTHSNTGGRVESVTDVYSVYDRSLRIQQDPYSRTGSTIDITM